MKNLLIKEMKLTASPCTYLFLLFTLMTFIPGYPITLGAFFVCYGIFFTYQSARECQDITYTVMLPVEKSQVVKAKFLFVVLIQMLAFLMFVLFTLVRMFLLKGSLVYITNQLVNANFAFLGYVLIIFTTFNICFLCTYFKTAYKFGVPFLIFSVISFILVIVFEVLHFIPSLTSLNDVNFKTAQLIPFAVGVVVYAVGTFVSLKISIKRFEKVDL